MYTLLLKFTFTIPYVVLTKSTTVNRLNSVGIKKKIQNYSWDWFYLLRQPNFLPSKQARSLIQMSDVLNESPWMLKNTTIIVKSHSVENSEISLSSVKFDEISATPVGFH